MDENNRKLRKINDYMTDRILNEIDDCICNGNRENRLSNNINVSFGNIDGKALLVLLDMEGVYVSGASACNGGEIITIQVALRSIHRHQFVADTFCISRLSLDEEGTVGTQSGSILFHLRVTDVEAESFIEQANHEGCIRRTATESGLRRNMFVEVSVNTRQLVVFSQKIVCLDHQVVFVQSETV